MIEFFTPNTNPMALNKDIKYMFINVVFPRTPQISTIGNLGNQFLILARL